MIERVVENWLTRVNERSLEVPFCQLLGSKGYSVVHLVRHGSTEEGKDILAVANDGVPCAFQLKTTPNRKITKKFWEENCRDEIIQLIEIPIVHPSIESTGPHRAFFVTNAELSDEVRLEIKHRNEGWKQRGYPILNTIVRGQLLKDFKSMHTNFWPTQLTFEKILLEFFLADGTGCLQKDKLSEFILGLLHLGEENPKEIELSRNLASAAVLTACALSSFSEKDNHVALIEGWIVYLANAVALIEKHRLQETHWRQSFDISIHAIEEAFLNLCDELRTRSTFVEGNPIVDPPFYRARITWLVGLVSGFALWSCLRYQQKRTNDWHESFVREHQKELFLWGEAAVPHFLAMIWFLKQTAATTEPDTWLATLIEGICDANAARSTQGLADPYHALPDVILELSGLLESRQVEYHKGRSYALEALVHLLARWGWRQKLRSLWPRISRLVFAEFRPVVPWQFCLWNSERGEARMIQPPRTQSWSTLKAQSASVDLSGIPELFQRYPEVLLLFTIVYPHRLTKDVAKFLDDRLRDERLRPR